MTKHLSPSPVRGDEGVPGPLLRHSHRRPQQGHHRGVGHPGGGIQVHQELRQGEITHCRQANSAVELV